MKKKIVNKQIKKIGFVPHSHESIGVPHFIEIAGRKIDVVFQPNLQKIVKRNPEDVPAYACLAEHYLSIKGAYGEAQYADNKIHLYPGSELYKPSKVRLQRAFLEEVAHWIFYVMRIGPSDLKPNFTLNSNEHFISLFTDLWVQVQKQLKDFTNRLES